MKYLIIVFLAFCFTINFPGCKNSNLPKQNNADSLKTDNIQGVEQDTFHIKDFRETSWGMNMNQVRKHETSIFVSTEPNLLVYETTLNGLKANVIYQFVDNKLARTGYMIKEIHSNRNNYIDDYDKIKNLLIKKYGTPTVDKTNWYNDLYRDTPQDYGMAVSIGHLKYISSWKTSRSEIINGLYGENYDIHHIIFYTSEEYGKSLDAETEKRALNDF